MSKQRRARSSRAYLGVLLTCLSCHSSLDPARLPAAATAFNPPSQYELWWQMTENCSGLSGRYDDVRWYSVPDQVLAVRGADSTGGDEYPSTNQIVLSQLGLRDPLLIRHEMLHALTRSAAHPRQYFRTRCSGYVSCYGECAREGGPTDSLPQPTALPVALDQLVVTTTVTPSAVSDSAYDGWFAITVSVTNPFNHPVRLRLATIPGTPDASQTFGWGFLGGRGATFDGWTSYGYAFIWSDSIGFDAGETRTRVIDEHASAFALLPASYVVRGWFNVDTAPATSFTYR